MGNKVARLQSPRRVCFSDLSDLQNGEIFERVNDVKFCVVWEKEKFWVLNSWNFAESLKNYLFNDN